MQTLTEYRNMSLISALTHIFDQGNYDSAIYKSFQAMNIKSVPDIEALPDTDDGLRLLGSNIVTDAMEYANTQLIPWDSMLNYQELDYIDNLLHC